MAILEFALILFVLILFGAAAAEIGVAFFALQRVSFAAAETVRIAASLPSLQANDTRVRDEINLRLSSIPSLFVSGTTWSNTAPVSLGGLLTTAGGASCDQAVTVRAGVNFRFFLLRTIGISNWSLQRSSTMRYHSQGLCM